MATSPILHRDTVVLVQDGDDGLATGSPDFANLTWVGWSSMATKKTVFYLDNVKLENR